MRRIIYYLLLLIVILGSTAVVLFVPQFFPKNFTAFKNGNDLMYDFVSKIIDGYKWGTTGLHWFTYALFAFLVLNTIIIFTMILHLIVYKFRLSDKKHFYGFSFWYIFSALVLSVAWMALHVNTNGNVFIIKDFLWYFPIPLFSGFLVWMLGLIFSFGDRRQ